MEIGTRPLSPGAGDVTARDALDRDVALLSARADAWARLGLAGKIRHLRAMRTRIAAVAERWVELAVTAKGIAGTPLAGEEWLSGPYALLSFVDRLIETLSGIARDGSPPIPENRVHVRADGQVVVDVFPADLADRLLLNGLHAEVWMEPGVTRENVALNTASLYRRGHRRGFVTLVLGAGNIAGIAPLDVLTVMYAHGSVALLKLNPVNAYLRPVFEDVFAGFIEEGFVRITGGGADAGAYLCAHDGVDAIHLTGGARTHDAIVFGDGADGEARKRAGTPRLAKRISSELGNVTPVIVVPGPWNDADIAFHAAHVATQKLHNAGANCIAAQVLLMPSRWPLAARFADRVRDALRAAPARPSYYPGMRERVAGVEERYGGERLTVGADGVPRVIVGLDANGAQALFESEAFAPVLAQTALSGDDPASFLRRAVAFCNERLYGTLGVSVLIHPRTIAALGEAFDDAVAALRYGCVAINTWPGVGFTLPGASWGAFPGNTLDDVGSGIGVVHNAFLFDRPQKTVVRAPFAPFPRSLTTGDNSLLPVPPWFVTHRRADVVGKRLFDFAVKPSPRRLAAVTLAALRA